MLFTLKSHKPFSVALHVRSTVFPLKWSPFSHFTHSNQPLTEAHGLAARHPGSPSLGPRLPLFCPCGGEFEGPGGSPGGNGRRQRWVTVSLTPWREMELKRLQVMGQHRADTKDGHEACGRREGRGEAVHRQAAVSEPRPCQARARPVSLLYQGPMSSVSRCSHKSGSLNKS